MRILPDKLVPLAGVLVFSLTVRLLEYVTIPDGSSCESQLPGNYLLKIVARASSIRPEMPASLHVFP